MVEEWQCFFRGSKGRRRTLRENEGERKSKIRSEENDFNEDNYNRNNHNRNRD